MKWIKINESAKNDEKIINKIKTLVDSLSDSELAASIRKAITKSKQVDNDSIEPEDGWFGGIEGAIYIDPEELGRDWEEYGVIKYKGKKIEVSDLEDILSDEYDSEEGQEDIYHTYFLDWLDHEFDRDRLKKMLIEFGN